MISNSWDIEQNILKLVILGNLCPFTPPPKNLQKSKFWKMKKFPGDIIILHCVPKITIIWCMVPEIWSEADRIFCHSGLLFAFYLPPPMDPENQNFEKNEKNIWRYYHLTNMYHKWQSYDVWFMRYRVQQTECFAILDLFCPFTPLAIPKIKILKKWKNHLEILLFYTGVT